VFWYPYRKFWCILARQTDCRLNNTVNRVSTPGVLAICRTVVHLNERPHLIPTSSNYDSYLIWCCGICLVDSAVVFVHFVWAARTPVVELEIFVSVCCLYYRKRRQHWPHNPRDVELTVAGDSTIAPGLAFYRSYLGLLRQDKMDNRCGYISGLSSVTGRKPQVPWSQQAKACRPLCQLGSLSTWARLRIIRLFVFLPSVFFVHSAIRPFGRPCPNSNCPCMLE
jgi:hypothetical protein